MEIESKVFDDTDRSSSDDVNSSDSDTSSDDDKRVVKNLKMMKIQTVFDDTDRSSSDDVNSSDSDTSSDDDGKANLFEQQQQQYSNRIWKLHQ